MKSCSWCKWRRALPRLRAYSTSCVGDAFKVNLSERIKESERSICVQVKSAQSSDGLVSVVERYGKVRSLFHFVSKSAEPRESLLVEFEDAEGCKAVLKDAGFQPGANVISLKSPFLWFGKRNLKSPTIAKDCDSEFKSRVVDFIEPLEEQSVYEKLADLSDMSAQMRLLFDLTKMTEVEVRLRYLVCQQILSSVQCLYPVPPRVVPFGSSVNGFGKRGADLDMVIEPCVPNFQEKNNLFFQAKEASNSPRVQTQRQLELVGDILSRLTPGCVALQRILQARVPIVRFRHDLADVDCDVSMDPLGSKMSELLWSFGEMDPRVRPLIFAVRKWARSRGLTTVHPGKWISNFGLTALVLFYLQCVEPSVIRVAFKGSEASPEAESKNEMNLGELLTGFFEFGGQFDFKTKGMSLVTGKACAKPDHSPLYVENPLDRSLNVTRNVSGDEVDRFVRQCRESAWSVESNHASLPDLLLPAGSSMRFDLTSVSTTLPKFQVKNLFSLGKEPGSPPDRKQKKDTGFRRSSVGKRAFTKR